MYTYFIYTVTDEGTIKTGEFISDNPDLETYDNEVPYCLGSNQYIELTN
jgi:hypothetical protein